MVQTVRVRLLFDENARYHGLRSGDFEFEQRPVAGEYFLHEAKASRFVGKITHSGIFAADNLESGSYFAYVETVGASEQTQQFWNRAFEGL